MKSRRERQEAARERVQARLAGVEDDVSSRNPDTLHNKVVAGAFCTLAAVMLVVMAVTPSQLERSDGHAPFSSEEGQEASSLLPETSESDAGSQDFDPANSTLPASLDPTIAETLLAAATDDRNAAYIVEHASEYAQSFGKEEQTKLLELAAREPSSREFVASALGSYPSDPSGALGDEPSQNGVPLLMQWDPRWALVEYSSAPMGLSGCAPTTLAMAYAGLTGKTDRTPADMAQLSRELACMDETEGTYAELFEKASPSLSLEVHRIPTTRQALLNALGAGALVVCNVGPGDFTEAGHFLLIVGVNEEGSLRINDPFSQANSSVSWDVDRMLGQTMGLYAARNAS